MYLLRFSVKILILEDQSQLFITVIGGYYIWTHCLQNKSNTNPCDRNHAKVKKKKHFKSLKTCFRTHYEIWPQMDNLYKCENVCIALYLTPHVHHVSNNFLLPSAVSLPLILSPSKWDVRERWVRDTDVGLVFNKRKSLSLQPHFKETITGST